MKISLPNHPNHLNNAGQISKSGGNKNDKHIIRWQSPKAKDMNADTLTVDTGSMDKTRDKMIRQLEDIAALPDEDRQKVAVKAYSKMQGMILDSANGEYKKQERFRQLQGSIAGMAAKLRDMGADDKTLNNPQTLSVEDRIKASNENDGLKLLEDEYAKAKSDLQRLITPSANKDAYALNNKFRQSSYAYYAAQFEAATGMTSPALDPYNDDGLLVFDRTEENFMDESNKRIDKLLARSKGLAATMNGYIKKLEDEAGDDPNKRPNAYLMAVVQHVQDVINGYAD